MSLPAAYQKEIESLVDQVRLKNPIDILQFCSDYFLQRLADERAAHFTRKTSLARNIGVMSGTAFTSPFGVNSNPFGGDGTKVEASSGPPGGLLNVVEEDENDTITSPTTPSFGVHNTSGGPFRGPFGGDGLVDGPPSSMRTPPNPDSYPAQYNFGRRTSVSAESLKPVADVNDNWTPPSYPKTPEQLQRLRKAIENNFLFSHLDDEQNAQILGALQEKPIPAKDIKVIIQGDAGDYFYIVEKGSFDVYVNPAGALQPGADGMGSKVSNIQAGGSFGELALMYNAPRAATVISSDAGCTLWALDRVTFRRILMESTFARRRLYESFLEEVPLLSSLTPYERSKIADALETKKFPKGYTIIRQGDIGKSFFLLEDGECDAYKDGGSQSVKHYKKGDFFGELALLDDKPRAADVVSTTEVKVATLGKNAFQRLLGPVESIMRRTRYVGVKSGVEDVDPLHA
ncbi:camp-dependent protein kinase regulatory subunit [Annulohypoxylon maeteangense]|uniref:camp-dependent protein kinase regulatory subunit n=1 Tax=Annulohypoxylon maeteangense TaxID=1927788 RepID=UPI0020076A22|nr:camp-dependent protein kinase regulatory subunit [Annulohypoxylon maeteangense]KAI0885424.1 camp-dependent protein kinase regulatory subunit [Annulohypoxylon maeteangense]